MGHAGAPSARPQPLAPADAVAAIAGFAQLLREHGLGVGVTEQQAMLRAALALPVDQARQVEAAWRAIACHAQRDWLRWPELFERYWHPQRLIGSVKVSGQTRPARDMRQLVQDLPQALAGSAQPPGKPGITPDAALAGAGLAEDEPGRAMAQGGATRTDALHDRSLPMPWPTAAPG